jgi:neutral ceramidase
VTCLGVRLVPIVLCSCTLSACAAADLRRQSAAQETMSVGVAQIDITPPEPIRLTGYGNRTTPSERVEQRLRAKALAFGSDSSQPAVLITADLIGISERLADEVARRLQKAGIERPQLAISTTHTHTGPALAGTLPFIFSTPLTPEQELVINRYSAELVNNLERVALDALANRQAARVAWGQGTAVFAANRRVLKDGKWTGFGIAPEGAVDHDLPVLTIRAVDGSLRAVLVSYACHATTLEGKENFVHGDWPGVAQELIERQHPGAIALVSIGTGADANPNPRGGGLPDVERHAREVAGEVERVIAGPMKRIAASPVGRWRVVDLPLAAARSRVQWEEQAKQKGATGIYAQSIVQRLERGEPLETSVRYPVQTWTFATDLAMTFLGGEVVADYGLRLKRELDASRLWINAYSNDVACYVPSKRMIPEGGYEVLGSMVYYGHPAPFDEGTEDLVVRTVKDLLPAVFRRQ